MGRSQLRPAARSDRQAPASSGGNKCSVPRIAQVLMRSPAASARPTSPVLTALLRTRIAISADEATCAWTPLNRRTTSGAVSRPTGSNSWRRIRQARACAQLTSTTTSLLGGPVVDELEAEAALDAEVPIRDGRIRRRCHLDDAVVLGVELDDAAHPAVGADGLGHGLGRLVPGPGLAHVVLGLEHQRSGRADADAVAAVHAGRLGQRHCLLGRDPGVEAATRDGDREGVLGLLAAGVDALVAEDAFRVVADVEVVVDLRGL